MWGVRGWVWGGVGVGEGVGLCMRSSVFCEAPRLFACVLLEGPVAAVLLIAPRIATCHPRHVIPVFTFAT